MLNDGTYKTAGIEKINNLKTILDSLQPIDKENPRRLDEKFRLEFNYNSNHIEGNTLTYGQTVMVLKFDKIIGDVHVSDVSEMKAHDVALKLVAECAKDTERPLTETFLKELNEIILVEPFWKEAISPNGQPTRKKIEIGKYKTTPNSVLLKNGEMFYYATPEETAAKMADLMTWYHQNLGILHPVHLAAEFHYRFVCIHPFDDGNGRVARLIMNYILQRFNYPILIIKSTDKEGYLTALQKADVGDLKSLLEYIEHQMIWSIEISIKAAKGEDITEDDDLNKEIELLKREKLTKGVIHKTPKVAFDLIEFLNKNLWYILISKIAKFDAFFSEVQDDIYLDDFKVEKTKRLNSNKIFDLINQQTEREVPHKPHEIFGRNLDEETIGSVKWKRTFLGLKSTDRRVDFNVVVSVDLLEREYVLRIYFANQALYNLINLSAHNILFEDIKNYKSLLYKEDIQEIVKMVMNQIIIAIKNEK